ncbi:uncharacterized protein BDZ99DRAFT_465668 [Mytilinidion resinicola]|uniref:ATPase AAA-type core domain-containing protein n=1 Tax=Mytilinidion resinicola TaxID=574789 RepID=A0A6A6YDM3_9PEZI|nr:uncharacterized protein BDZ99DRAFT_465668 [Mytilinidion resinicola]KAF2806916.1 hypothetical protein BDZ99DRAFT_465668 [Mytilinidion resinicola]
MRGDWDLFGTRNGYIGSEGGSSLNNFLASNSGQRSVVFLDEFDKTAQEVRTSLLTVCESGKYEDRRHNTAIDCSRTIWIMATNLGKSLIETFYAKKMDNKSDEERDKVPIKPLQDDLKKLFSKHWKPALASRIKLIVPFFPFSRGEAAVVTHKFFLDLFDQVKKPVVIRPGQHHWVGHCHLTGKGTEICEYIAKEEYEWAFGARVLNDAVIAIANDLFISYTRVDRDEEITEETNNGPLQRFDVQLRPTSDGNSEAIVLHKGHTVLPVEWK